MKATTQSLISELKIFGLDPKHWTLIREKSNTYRIKNKRDQHFIFKGQVKQRKQQLTWDFIDLVSL